MRAYDGTEEEMFMWSQTVDALNPYDAMLASQEEKKSSEGEKKRER